MANEKHLTILKRGVVAWNEWREKSSDVVPDLSGAALHAKDFSYVDFHGANLSRAYFNRADLNEADLSEAYLDSASLSDVYLGRAYLIRADLSQVSLSHADLSGAELSGARLSGANLSGARLKGTNLSHADLSGTNLSHTDLSGAYLNGVNLCSAKVGWTTFANNDLSVVKGLETVIHIGPSTIGIDTLYRSQGKISPKFLSDAGLPEVFLTYLSSLLVSPISFHSCFISYSHKDEEFAKCLYSRMKEANLRVWYAPEEMKGGEKIHEQIFSAIQVHDKLLLVLSEHSLKSEWVMTEIRRARKAEREENRRKLFPIKLVDFDAIQKWECFDADSGKDLAVEMREYFIPDFANWKDPDSFEKAFDKLLRDLKADEKQTAEGQS